MTDEIIIIGFENIIITIINENTRMYKKYLEEIYVCGFLGYDECFLYFQKISKEFILDFKNKENNKRKEIERKTAALMLRDDVQVK